MKAELNYRTGSGSDLAVPLPLNQCAVELEINKTKDNLSKKFESIATAGSLPLPVL
ncbi:MAG TPA: hypothetical protein VGW36_08905 [Pyrinomonadaceae bacterium]|nr:hypothetical protein [Pyrinomonadaceae bacterium]